MQCNKERLKNKDSKISKQNHIIEEICGNGEMQYKCTACHKTFRSRSQKYYHLNCNQLHNLIYKCEHCEKGFARQSQWKYHIESHLSPFNECHKCQKTFSNPLALKKHVALHEVEPKLCPHCDKTFKKKISLDEHIAAQHLNQLQYGCAYCSKKYASKSTLQLHLQTHENKRFECLYCRKRFQRKSILNLHLKRHYKTNNYMCTVCQKVFSESGALARHRKIHEENVMQYHCKLCDKSILRKDNMLRHLNSIHPEEKFDNIVEILRPPIITSNHSNEEDSKDGDIYNFKEKHITNIEKKVVIIENKLLQKPFELKDSTIGLSKNSTNETDNVGYPLINQIGVIMAVPTYEKDINNMQLENASQELILHHSQVTTKILQNSEDSHKNSENKSLEITSNCDLNKMSNEFIKHSKNIVAKISFQSHLHRSQNQTEQQTKIKESSNNQKYCLQHPQEKELNASAQVATNHIYEAPKTQTISSVIRSVGNVKRNLDSFNVASAKSLNQTCLEYKHKKYCRNNYNIDLYRKILGCNDEDDEVDKDQQPNYIQTESEENMLKTSTPVHWRKSFKNNYETSSS